MEENSRFRISATEGVIELEGSEAFVSQHIEGLRQFIEIFAQRIQSHHETITSLSIPASRAQLVAGGGNAQPVVLTSQESDTTTSSVSPISVAQYPHTFAEMSGVLRVVAEVPGENTRKKMTNAILLYGYGCYLQGMEKFPSDDARQVCEDHGILDVSNFSKAYDDRTTFIVEGAKRAKKTIKLTHGGLKAAKALVESIEADAGL